ncbi:LTF [Branchiostoma lanceolatum]|uniref:LTF protein n=1 Tax=Branchiostoma lanceolatum TaxID=7740 RepID=A0A8K0A1N5_BRALA|nr:LTF [Branchiostoma lanceolatum]CAH1266115.1 LTF [Branchiostoma lanceolatum]
MRVPAILALLCWVACASAWECDSNAEHLTAVDIKIKSHEDHVIYGQLHACPRAGEELSPNLRFRFQNQRNIILDEETGSFEYSPDREHFSGVHNFDYTVEDEVERSEPASVFISLRPHPDEPRLQVQHVQGNEGEVIPLHIQAQLEDEDGSETLTVTLCNCGQEVSCKSKKCKCQLSVPSGWHFLAGGQRVHRRSLNKLTPDQANQLSIQVPENSHGQYCFGVHAITVEQKGKGHINAQVSQDMHITVHSRNQPPTITHHSKTETVRWCTISAQEQQKCQEMSRAFIRRLNHRLECVQGQSSEDCMYKISHNMADVITLDGGDIYTAGSKYSLVPVMGEDYGNGDASYWAVAVVHKDNRDININNLQGHKSCHTGIGKTSGWNVPVGWLIQNNQMKMDSRKSIPQAVGKFFSKSCVPGAQSPEYNPDGTNPESLCSLCVGEGDNRCVRNTNEPYYGYSGAFRCLVEGAGDVAFVNHVTVYENTNGHSEEEWTRNLDEDDFELLCPDGSRQPWNQYKECNLARVPAHAVMTSYHSRKNLQQIVDVLNQAQEHFGTEGSGDFQMFDSSEFEGRDLMFRDNVQRLVPVGQRNTWQKWLGSSYMESVGHLISHDEQRNQRVLNKQIRWCATSDAEMEKCERLSKTLTEGGFVPTVKCVRADNAEQCMQMIHRNQADVITLDGGDIYQAGMKYNMRPIMGEDYGNGDASYWAVAVVRKDNSEININNLRGRKSCHTGIGKTSGWIIPTGWLVDQDFVHTDGQTSLVQAVGHFFSQSCVPGAKSPEYDPQNTNPSNLCSLCAGAGEDHCVRNKNEPYYGYAGAFRCLAEGSGDVAFINHLTVQDNTDGHNPENWAAGLRSNEFELLCTDGSRRPVDQWRECSLARVPSHAVMTSNDRNQEWVDRAVQLLKNTQDMFGTDENERGFQLFDSASFGGHDLLFRDDTHHLVEVGSKDSWEKWLGQEYLRCIRSHHAVEPVQPHSTLRWCTISSQEQQKCQEMSQHVSRSLNHRLECVQGQSSEDCMYKISHHQADVITLDGGDIYTAGSEHNLVPVMGEDYGNGDASYWAVAVVRKDNREININNVQGRKSCHTGIGKTSGWNVPVGWLIQNNQMQVDSRKSIPQAVGKFFSKSCVPGAQGPEYNPDGTNPESLCSLCVGEGENRCVRNTNEPYYGYSGAFRCLVEGAGDVAFVNHVTVYENTNGHSEEEWTRNLDEDDFELLCPDGSRQPWNQYKECNLARVPSHSVMTSPRSRTDIQQIVDFLKLAQDHFGFQSYGDFEMFDSSKFGGRDLMFRDNVQRLVPVGQRNTWQKWLGSSYMESVGHLISHDEQRNQHVLDKQVRWCVTSDAEREKCEALSRVQKEGVSFPTIKCVQADNADQCSQMIHMNQADVITLDGGDIYQAGMKYNMRPIMGEDYGNGDASYWAVAVVRKDNSEININNLRGRKSCHTGIGKTSGWIIPTGWLVDQDFVHTDGQTSLVQAVGQFFSKSCVPGAKSPEYDPQNTNPSNLCSLCAGAGEDHCVRNKNEPYYGYAGAFRCLAEGSGDVAFINHLTVQDNTDGHNPENWAAGLRSNEFELLCTDGSRRPVDQWRECSLARVPSHAVMTSNDRSQEWVNRVVRLLKGAQDMFGTDENERDFQMFDSASFGGHDLLFRDDTHHLVEVGSKDSWEKWLGQEYLRCIRSHHAVEHHDMHSMRSSGQQPALSTSEGRPVLLSNLRIQDAEGHNGRYHVHATVNQGGHLWIRDGLDGVVFTSDAKTTNKHHARHHRHQDPHQHQEESHPVESELSWEDSSSQEDSRSQSHESQSHESQSHERNHQDSNPISHLWDSLWQMWDENSSEEKHHSSEEGQRRHHSSEEGQHRHSSEESHQDRTWDDVHTSTETKRQELTKDDDFYQHYKHHHFQYSNNGRPTLSFSGDLASVQKAVSSMVFVPWCEQWPTPPNWDLPPTTWMFPSEEDQDRSEDPNHPVIWPAWYPRFWYPFPTKAWTWWPRVLPPYWLNKQCQDWTSMIHISVSEEAPSSCASQQDRQDRPVTDMDIPVHVQSRTNAPISLIPRNLFYYFASDAESVPINDIYIRSELTDVNLRLNFKVMENHLATVQAESVEAPEFTCTSVEECNEHLRTVKVHFKNGVTATDFCHLGIQISMFKDNSDVPSDLLTVWAYQTSGQCVDPWATNGNFHLSKERSQTNQGQTVDINLIPDDLSNEESLNGILHVTIRAAHGLVTYTAPDGLRTFIDHMGVHQRIPTNICVSGPAEMVKQALQTIKYTPIRAFTGTDNITIEYGTTRTAMRLSPDKIHRKMTVVHKVEVRPVSSPILVQAPSHMCVHRQQRPLPHIDTNLKLQSLWHKPTPNMVKLTVTATSGDVNINEHKLQEQFHPHQNSEEHHRDMVHLDLDVQHRQRASGSWLQVVAEDWVVRHILHNQLVWYKPNKCVSSGQPIRHDTVHVEVEEVSSEHVTNSEIQVTVDCHQNQQQRWQVDGVSSEENSRGSHESRGVSSQWSLELSPWSVEQSSTEVEVTSDTECVPAGSWKEWSECNANSCQMGSQWRERPTRNSNPASNRYCQPQREQRQCTNCGCKPERQFVKHPSPSFQNCQTVRQVLRCPETCKPTKTSFVEEQFNCRGRTLSKDVLVHEACACVECAAKHTKESWHSSERQPSSNERWSEELGFPWY